MNYLDMLNLNNRAGSQAANSAVNYYTGPAGSSGGIVRPPAGTGGQYGYGTGPGQTGRGYYEQGTPVGSFAAAEQQRAGRRPDVMASTANNPYLGATSGTINGQGSIMPYANQVADAATQANPYLGQTTKQAQGVGSNPYGMGNPYLEQQIAGVTRNATAGFNDVVNPQFDRAAQQSGSFGNTGVEAARGRAMNEFGSNLANTVGGMRMQDYTQQQQLAEAGLNRAQQNNQFNAGLGAGDLNRNTGAFLQGQGLGIQGLNSLVGAAQFDAGLGSQTNMFNANLGAQDIGRNANLAQNMGQFNAGQLNNMGQFNQSQGNALSMFDAGQGNAMGQFNAGQGNSMINSYLNRNQQTNQFDQGMDFQTWQANQNNMRQGTRDQLDFLNTLLGMQGQGINSATNVQNTPLNYYNQFANIGGQLGGLGGTNTQNLQGNPWLSGIGGAMTGAQLWNQFNGG